MTLRALLANDTSLIGHHGSAIVVDRLTALCAEAGIALERGHGWKSLEARSDFSAFDLMIVNGEGSLHREARTARRIADLIERAGRLLPVYLVNTIAEDLDAALVDKLRAARRIVTRDRPSAAALQAAGLDALTIPDATMTLPPPLRGSVGRLTFTDSVKPDVAAILADAAMRAGADLLRFDAEPGPDRSDRFGLKRIRRRFKIARGNAANDVAIPRTADFVAHLARDVSGLVTGRFHGVCLALRLGVPFLAVGSNTRKVEALLDEAGMRDRLVTPDRVAAENLVPPPFDADEDRRRLRFLDDVETGWRAVMREIAEDVPRSGQSGR